MVNYSCELCGKQFKQKGHYTNHINKKNPCITNSKLVELFDKLFERKIEQEIKKGNLTIDNNKIVYKKTLSTIKTKKIKTKKIKNKKIITKKLKQKPFLKWVGGKTQIIDTLMDKFPKEMNNYHEPFLGGGSVLFALLSLQQDKKITINGTIYAYDYNNTLINVYKHIQTNKDELFEYIQKYINEYDSCKSIEINRKAKTLKDAKTTKEINTKDKTLKDAKTTKEINTKDKTLKDVKTTKKINRKAITLKEAKTSKESYYYWMRNEFNSITEATDDIKKSALFIVINKTCFRGMYREGPNGFNIPYGHYKKTPKMITKEQLNTISELIKDVVFKCCDFKDSFKEFKKDDFVYLDPPYAPKNNTSFVNYTKDGFNLEQHNNLFTLIKKLSKKKVKFIMSNAKVDLVTDTFKDFNMIDILCKRSINSKNPGSKAMEVLVSN